MRDEITRIYKVPKEKIGVVSPNTAGWITGILRIYADLAGGSRKS